MDRQSGIKKATSTINDWRERSDIVREFEVNAPSHKVVTSEEFTEFTEAPDLYDHSKLSKLLRSNNFVRRGIDFEFSHNITPLSPIINRRSCLFYPTLSIHPCLSSLMS